MSAVANSDQRLRAIRQARQLAWAGNVWHLAEFVVALAAGIAAGSVALVAFGVDSLIELAAGTIIIWRFAGSRRDTDAVERQAQRLLAATFFALTVYVLIGSTRSLLIGTHPAASRVGIGLAAVTATAMPLLAAAKRRVGRDLGSLVTEREGGQNRLCAYLSVALLVGLGANAVLGWWWADPVAAMVIGLVAAREGVAAWRGRSCDCQPAREPAAPAMSVAAPQERRGSSAPDGAAATISGDDRLRSGGA